MTIRTIEAPYLTRVEGEGSLLVRLKGEVPIEVRLQIFEPPRFFEAILRGRACTEAPDITARICGICPVAYQMSACQAVERALGVTLPPSLRSLRRLLYCGEWIESHTLHAFMLHAPDFLGYPDAIAMARDHGPLVRRGLRIKKAGNALVTAVGGREIHPINVKVGGFYRAPDEEALRALLPELTWAREAALESLRDFASFSFPEVTRDYELVSLVALNEYPMNDGQLCSTRGVSVSPESWDDAFVEHHVEHSTALHATTTAGTAYLTGPLARYAQNHHHLSADVRKAAIDAGLAPPVLNPFKTILVRMVETAQALGDAISIIEHYRRPDAPSVGVPMRAGTGGACTEAPRGTLFHRYEIGEGGIIEACKIIPPTSQNQRSIEQDLATLAPELARLPLDAATRLAEQAVRNHDPCISCSTHFLTLSIEREPPG